MPAQENKVLARYYLEQIFNHKNLAAIEEFVAHNVLDHSLPPGFPAGLAGYGGRVTELLQAFPDLHLEYQDFTCEADRVLARYTLSGTHQGEFAGVSATGKAVQVSGMEMLRFKDGKVIERWNELDLLGFFQQLGVISEELRVG